MTALHRIAQADTEDPVFAAIVAADKAQRAHLAALDGLDEDDDAQMRRANIAADAETKAFERLTQTMPTTLSGLRALVERYAVEAEETERWSAGGSYLRHIARVLACESECPFWPLERQFLEAHQDVVRLIPDRVGGPL
ncbi:hypothetical protein [Methylorubrum extorquens]|uniref:Uncharacterized protein n=1 Tax=Methylorubrum extorquens (strain ATCC 14718 / DSM 1338 / JCM 2805 / NCIMB 9133 / AM1) TaxID=272630 RepID=C5ARP2_METEA|nr:hypothetical protein [Methylorubrum extorquens]ACS42380.1 Hypothetical protein MexAM1_META1p4753 [Methylorubrum extorquens AM1]MCP1544567.1 hypothetical protein [Methylorubrum extorquens]MCP1588086.1 hypothetical protein [Methylorubrum extorquens]